MGDYLKRKITTLSDVAVCIYCDFGALIPSEQKLFLHNVHDSLHPNGIFIFDVFADDFSKTNSEHKEWAICETEDFWSHKPHYVLSESVHFRQNHCWGRRTIIINRQSGRDKEFITWDQYYTVSEISDLLNQNGFNVEKIERGLVQKNDFTSKDVLFVKARKI